MIEGLIAECDQVSAESIGGAQVRACAHWVPPCSFSPAPVGNHGENLPSMLGSGVDQ